MLKKIIKSLMTIAAVCVVSTAGYAEYKVTGSAAASFGTVDTGALSGIYQMRVFSDVKGGDLSSRLELRAYSADGTGGATVAAARAYVTWNISDSMEMSIGTPASVYYPMLGYMSVSNSNSSLPNTRPAGTNPDIYSSLEALQFVFKLGDVGSVFAGLQENGTTDATMYGIFEGKAGDISYIAGMRTVTGGGDANTRVSVKYDLSSEMCVGAELGMAGSVNTTGVVFKMANAGPGDLAVMARSNSSKESATVLKYAYNIAEGSMLEVNYHAAGTSTWMGVTLAGRF